MDDNPGRLPLDQNRRNVIGGVSTADGKTVLPAEINSSTSRLLVDAAITSGGGSGGTSSNFGSTFPAVGTAVGASDGTNMQPLLVDGSGNLKVNVEAGGGGGTQYTDGGTPPTHPIGNALVWNNSGTWEAVSATEPLPVTATLSLTNYALESGGNLAAIKADTDKIPSLGQALAASSVPVVLTAAQITTLTPPAAITNYALETGGNLATLAGGVSSSIYQSNVKQINGVVPLMGNGVTGTGSQRVTIASDNSAFSVNATLSAETTKVIGTVNQGTSPWVVSNGGTFAVQATLSAETTKVIGVTRTADGSGNLLTSTANALDVNIKSGFGTSIAVTNAGTFAVQDTVLDAALIAQETTTSGIKGLTAFGAVTTNAPTYSTTKSDALSLDTSGLLRVSLKDTPSNTNKLLVTADAITIAASQTIAVTNTGTFAVQATLSAETTKVIGVTRTADGSGNLLTSTGNALDINIKSGNLTTLPVTNVGTFAVQNTAATPAGTNAIGSVNLSPTAVGGWTGYALGGANAALTTTQTVSAAAGKFGGYMTLINLNSSPCYIQVFDTTGAVTLGSTAPTYIIAIPANSTAANGVGANMELSNGLVIANGIKIAATTTSNGASTVATGVTGTILFK